MGWYTKGKYTLNIAGNKPANDILLLAPGKSFPPEYYSLVSNMAEDKIELRTGDSEAIQFPDLSFDAVTVAFGVRNFENLGRGLDELFRVLKPGGTLCVLEFSKPRQPMVRLVYRFYSKNLMPRIGRMVSGDQSAYTYLPESVEEFPDGEKFITFMRKSGFEQIREYRLTFGIATIYIGIKGPFDKLREVN